MTLSLSNVTPRDWQRVCLYLRRALRREIRLDQAQARALALKKGKANEASLIASFRRTKPRSTTFNDQVTAPHRETNWKAAAKVAAKETA